MGYDDSLSPDSKKDSNADTLRRIVTWVPERDNTEDDSLTPLLTISKKQTRMDQLKKWVTTERDMSQPDHLTPLIPVSTRIQDEKVASEDINQDFSVLVLMMVLLVVVNSGTAIEVPSLTQVINNAVCWRHFGSDGSDGTPITCGVDAIVDEVALIMQVKEALGVIPGILLAIPMGMLADRVGRKPVLMVCLLGMFLRETIIRCVCYWWTIFPTRYIWFASVTGFIGGGPPVAGTMIYTIIADVTTPAQRANIFYYGILTVLAAGLTGSMIGAYLVAQKHEWMSLMGAYVITTSGFLTTPFLNETLHPSCRASNQMEEPESEQVKVSIIGRVRNGVSAWLKSTHFIWENRNVPLLLSSFFFCQISSKGMVVLILYATRKFHVSVGDAAFTTSFFSMANIISLLTLPLVAKYLVSHRGWCVARKDLFLATFQATLLLIGSVTIALAPTTNVMFAGTLARGLGAGFHTSVRALITAMVDPCHYATLYGSIEMIQGLGSVTTVPAQAIAFTMQMEAPFYIEIVVFSLIVIALSSVHLPKEGITEHDDDENEDWDE